MISQTNIMKSVVSGHQLAYHRAGTGETVLLVHGITTYSFIWRRIVPLLSNCYDVIAVDLLGCGESDKPLDVEYSVKNHADLLREFVHSIGVSKFHFVGHDIGGGIGQVFSARYPEMLLDLTMINTVAYDLWPVQPIIAMRTPIVRQFVMGSLDWGTFKLFIRRGLYHKDRLTPELMDLFWKPMKTKDGRKAFLHFAKSLNNQHLLEIAGDLRNLQLPVLIVRGDSDPYLSSEIAEKLHREIPGSELIRIATGAHFLQEDEPEQLVTHIADFFEENVNATRSRGEV